MERRRRVIALGFFDGVHQGHGALLRTVRARAAELDAAPSALTFDRHPGSVITGRQVATINSVEDRVWLMKSLYGIEDVVVARFDERMMHEPWREFVTGTLIEKLGAVHVVAGSDFRFGDRGEGDARRLCALCREMGIGCDIVGMVEVDGEAVHSTRIRALLAEGEMERANRLLGHPHVLTNRVVPGKHLGSSLGFPTVNLHFPEGVLVPAFGVYASQVRFGEERRAAVTNIGVRPTVEQHGKANVEGFILDYSGDLYGQSLHMEFYRRLRPERKFPDVQTLTAEVLKNVGQTREYFESI